MSAATAPFNLFHGDVQIVDPGDAGNIAVDRSPAFVNLVSAAAETRTLRRPTRLNAIVTLHMRTDGGNITLTVTGGYNLNGLTTYTFSDAGQSATFISCYDGTNYYWRKIADTQAMSEVLTTTRTVRADESGKTFYLSLAGGFVTTLPAPALDLKYTFIVKTVPTGGAGYTVVASGSANVMMGSISVTTVDTDVDGSSDADGDTITLVDDAAVAGDQVTIESDGTNWYVRGSSLLVTGVTITKAT